MAKIYYTPSKGSTPKFGESGQSVKELQTQLNQKNAGVSGYTPLKVDGLYGPKTQAAAGMSAPASNTPSQTPTITPSDTAASGYFQRTTKTNTELDRLKKIATNIGDAPDEKSIRNALMKNSQAIIDQITAQYAGTISQERQRGDMLNKRQRAVNVGAGLGGSDFASQGAQKVEDQTLKAIQTVEAERDAKIAATLSGVAFRANELYETRRKEYRGAAEDAIKKYAEFKDMALTDIADMASSGLTAAQLKEKSPDTWNQLLEQTGYDDVGLTAQFVKNKPEPDFKEKVGNSVIYGYRDPQTGKITTEKVPLVEGYTDFQMIDGEPYFVDVDNGKIKKADGYTSSGGGSGSGKKITSGKLVTTADTISAGQKALNDSRGEDNWVDPGVYKQLYDVWAKEGGLDQDFVKQYPPKNYVNPANTWLPDFLKNKTVQKKETTKAPLF